MAQKECRGGHPFLPRRLYFRNEQCFSASARDLDAVFPGIHDLSGSKVSTVVRILRLEDPERQPPSSADATGQGSRPQICLTICLGVLVQSTGLMLLFSMAVYVASEWSCGVLFAVPQEME